MENNSAIHGMLITLVAVAPQELLIEQLEKGLDEERVKTLLLEGYAFKRKNEKMTPETEEVISFINNERKPGNLTRNEPKEG